MKKAKINPKQKSKKTSNPYEKSRKGPRADLVHPGEPSESPRAASLPANQTSLSSRPAAALAARLVFSQVCQACQSSQVRQATRPSSARPARPARPASPGQPARPLRTSPWLTGLPGRSSGRPRAHKSHDATPAILRKFSSTHLPFQVLCKTLHYCLTCHPGST